MVSARLRWGALVSFVVSMSVLLIGGAFNRQRVPPYPQRLVADGQLELDGRAIMRGQGVYQRYGLMDHGSVWGHGTLRGMDFSATSLHRIGQSMRDYYARQRSAKAYEALDLADRAVIDQQVVAEIKTNRYDPATGTLVLTAAQAHALRELTDYWQRVFGEGDKDHGFLPGTVRSPQQRDDLAAFFFWTAWAAGTNRPGQSLTYTNNWPPDRSVGNDAPPQAIGWSMAAIAALLIGLGLTIFVVHRYRFFYGEPVLPDLAGRLADAPITPSQRESAKFFLVVAVLFILQILNGGLLAHYSVHPASFYLDWIARLVPYSWAKSWHVQLAIFWIAVAWIGSSLYIGPLVGGREPRRQGLLNDILFAAIVVVALGALLGEAAGIKGWAGRAWFWLGHQGWEYLELGRLWQILLFIGLLVWLVIAYRVLAPRLGRGQQRSGLTQLYLYSAIAVVGFFGFGLFYNPQTHLSIADYWRWFVVHIWVEGMFEFFAAATLALLLVALGLVEREVALRAAYLTAILVFCSGIIGTAHHYFWFGAPSFWMPLGAVFSSLEPVPLILLVVRAWMEYRRFDQQGRRYPYRWPLMFLTASSFWNFLGAGVFGFMINLPIVNYYEHATYLTSNHGHTALFGVYGMLAVALALFSWRNLVRPDAWSDSLLRCAFWGLNGGLFLMFLLTLLPVGLAQVLTSYHEGLWLARSAEFYQRQGVMLLLQLRMLADAIVILLGAVPLAIFLFKTAGRLRPATVGEGHDVFAPQDRLPL
ncbi:MAG: nitric-oxide reductase large subunit [Phycisphaerae bacterium]